jgi:DNA mismatch repair ATPase MutS
VLSSRQLRRERQRERLADFLRAGVGSSGTYQVDDRTWGDLGLDAVFDASDRTLSAVGEQVLYAHLRRPTVTSEALADRLALVEHLEGSPAARDALRRELSLLGTADGDYLADMIWRNDRQLPISLWTFRLAALAATMMIAVPFVFSVMAGALGLVAMLLLNMWLHGRARLSSSSDMRSVRYLSRFLRTAHRLGRTPELEPARRAVLARLARESRALRRKLAIYRLLNLNAFDELLGTINVYFLIEARTCASAFGEIVRLRPLLQQAFAALGALDCAQSISKWRSELPSWTKPVLATESQPTSVIDLVHPLLADPVPNSVTLEGGGLVVTGSNMSGKSTFLRSVGVGAVLAQAIGTVTARSYSAGFLQVRSVMSGSDDLLTRKSYYLDEAQAVLHAIDGRKEAASLLCVFDELFRGTNSAERVAAGVSVVRWLVERGGLVVLATHDLHAAVLLEEALVSVHFRDQVDDRGITFDHRLRPGPAPRTNALDVLAHVGYPPQIVEQGRRIASLLTGDKAFSPASPALAGLSGKDGTSPDLSE